jgi:hypothetical protein
MNSYNQQVLLFTAFFLLFLWILFYQPYKTSGSWDALFTDSSGTLSNVTYTGNYNRTGKMVFFCVNVKFNQITALGTGQYQITLPFQARQTFTSRGGTLHNPTTDARYHIAGILDTTVDNKILKFYYTGSTTDLAWKFSTPVSWASPVGNTGIHFDVSGFYEILT